MSSSFGEPEVIYGRCVRVATGELFVPSRPVLDEICRREVIKTINVTGNKSGVDVRKPPVHETSGSRSSDDESQVRQNECLGGEVRWACEL